MVAKKIIAALTYLGLTAGCEGIAQREVEPLAVDQQEVALAAPPQGPQAMVVGAVTLQYATDEVAVYSIGQKLYGKMIRGKSQPFLLLNDIGSGVQAIGTTGGGTIASPLLVWHNINPATGIGSLSALVTLGSLHAFEKLSDASLAPMSGGGRSAFASGNGTVLFTDNVSADGTVGSIAWRRIIDREAATLLTNVNVDMNSKCRPSLGFNGSLAVVETCAAGDTLATLTTWQLMGSASQGVTLATGLKASNLVRSSSFSNAGKGEFLVYGSNREPELVSQAGTTALWPEWGQSYAQGQIISDDTAVLLAPDPETGTPAIFRITHLHGQNEVKRIDSTIALLSNHLQGGFWYYNDRMASPDGQKILYATESDPNTGLVDINVANLGGAEPTHLALAAVGCTQSPSLFTADSRYAVFACMDESGAFIAYAGDLSTGDKRPISAAGFTFANVPLADGRVVVGDNTDANYTVNDIKVVNPRDGLQSAKLLATSAGQNYFVAGASGPAPQLIFVLPQDTAGLPAGLYKQAL